MQEVAMAEVRIYTIGFGRKNAEGFFGLLRDAGVRRIVDVRLHNTSQLAGFTKRDDLAYFLREIVHAGYVHVPELTPTAELLVGYKKLQGSWDDYARKFNALPARRGVEATVMRDILHEGCLLCSEPTAAQCHRRLVAEYFRDAWRDVEVIHL
jgi:uncharacterized protein (DUF488 family)